MQPSEARARTNASSSAATAEAPHDGDDAFAAAPVVSDGDDDDNVGAGNSSGTSAGYYQRRGERCPVRTAIAAVVLFAIGTVRTHLFSFISRYLVPFHCTLGVQTL